MFAEAFSGMGLGVLVGLLLGLSSTSLVGEVMAALMAGLAAFLGLAKAGGPDRAMRIGFFGFACALGGVGGLALRASDVLAPDIKAQVQRWTDAGYSAEDAQSLVAYERLGVRPAGRQVGPAPTPVNAFYATQSGLCSRLNRVTDASALLVLRAADDRSGNAILAARAAAATADQPAVLHAGITALCD
ncbi:hypothetical protein [Acidisoma sp. C75]